MARSNVESHVQEAVTDEIQLKINQNQVPDSVPIEFFNVSVYNHGTFCDVLINVPEHIEKSLLESIFQDTFISLLREIDYRDDGKCWAVIDDPSDFAYERQNSI